MANPALPSLDFLLTCSRTSLHDLELAGLNRSRNHTKAAMLELEEAIAQREIAAVARFLIEYREEIFAKARQTLEQSDFEFPSAAA
jgi:hypothetical protein